MGEFIDFLLICTLVYYVLRALIRFFVPVLFEKVVNKAQQQQQYRQTDNQQQNYNRTDAGQGNIKVDYVPPHDRKKGSIPDSEGDFVDYEDVK
jgi:hypothetical protein